MSSVSFNPASGATTVSWKGQDCPVSAEESIGSFVVIKTDSITGKHFEHREGIYAHKGDVFYLAPGDYLYQQDINLNLIGQPSQESSEAAYLKALDEYLGEDEKVDWVLDDILNDLASNVPGQIQVIKGDEKEFIYSQVEQDLHRISSLTLDGNVIKSNDPSESSANPSDAIYLKILKGLGDNVPITQAVTKLITQTNLYRTYYLIWKKFVLENSHFSLTTLRKDYSISTKSSIGYLNPFIVFKEQVEFALKDHCQMELEGIRFMKVIRIVKLKKKNISKGLFKGSTVTNYYSPFFSSKKEMQRFDDYS